MNSKERINLILAHKEADYVPAYPLVNSISWKYTGIGYDEWSVDPVKCAESIIAATDALDLDIICNLIDLSVEAADWGMKVDYFPEKAAMPNDNEKLIQCPEDYEKVQVIDIFEGGRMANAVKTIEILKKERGDEKPIVAFVFGPMGILSMMTGMDTLMKDCMKKNRKDLALAAIERITETLIKYCDKLIDAGADAIMFDTLFSSKTILRASMWDVFEGPSVQKLAEHVHGRGVAVMIHNCGEGTYFKEQIARMHPEAISTLYIPADCETMAEMKEKYGDQTTIIGHVDPGFLMVTDEERLRKMCEEMIDTYKKDGGFVLATGCEYPSPLDDTFAKVMVDVCKTYGRY